MQSYMKKKQWLLLKLEKLDAVTIATNMAGRGTDIKLGGNKDFILDQNSDDTENIKKTS